MNSTEQLIILFIYKGFISVIMIVVVQLDYSCDTACAV